jgi:hypothetical protein
VDVHPGTVFAGRIWNGLPSNVVTASTYGEFLRRVGAINL